MRSYRPEYYSDTQGAAAYRLDASALEQRLDTLTARNQTHDFEVFCRKLCERLICPNLKPATGPEGGGDSKADSETIAVADEISTLGYIGEANAGRERWAFAFSAKKTWASKARKDIDGIAATDRGYTKVFFVTSQYARAKARAELEDELSKTHGFRVEILDRSWIVDRIIECGYADLAVHYLGVGEVVKEARLGPLDYSRSNDLADLEKSLQDPKAYEGMEGQRVTDALVAAKLSRGLDRPRFETDGRFNRAIRQADDHGTFRQKLEARYERLWTAFYWFDDIALLEREYDVFEAMALSSDAAKNLEFAGNLLQNLFTVTMHGLRTAEEVGLTRRVDRLKARLETLAAEAERPNNALEAETSLLILEVNLAMLEDRQRLAGLWPRFSSVLDRARGLGEFSTDRVVKLVEVFGQIAGDDEAYSHLIDQLAAFVGARVSEGEGAKVLLKRARQISETNGLEAIRLLGRASLQLSKREYAEELVEATYLLSVAYRGAGMLWAARTSALYAVANLTMIAEEDSEYPVEIIPALMLLCWIDVELRHLPELMDSLRLLKGARSRQQLDSASETHLQERLDHLDLVLAAQMLNFTEEELHQVTALPDLLGGLGLTQSQGALLYALGHEDALGAGQDSPDGESFDVLRDLYGKLASQPAGDLDGRPLITNEGPSARYETRILGMRVSVVFATSETSLQAAEAIVGSLESFFATMLSLRVGAHTEIFEIRLVEREGLEEPEFELADDSLSAVVSWPAGASPTSPVLRNLTQPFLLTTAGLVFAATCAGPGIADVLKSLTEDDALMDRGAMIAMGTNSRNRAFNAFASHLGPWTAASETVYPVQADRPLTTSTRLREPTDAGDPSTGPSGEIKDHRRIEVRSIIDIHAWDRAGWTGMFFASVGPNIPPIIGLHFRDKSAARRIFARWRERVGQSDLDNEIHLALIQDLPDQPKSHYAALVTSGMDNRSDGGRFLMVPARLTTMTPATDQNLQRFLSHWRQAGCFLLAAAVFDAQGDIEIQKDLTLLKRDLVLKKYGEITDQDIESVAFGLIARTAPSEA